MAFYDVTMVMWLVAPNRLEEGMRTRNGTIRQLLPAQGVLLRAQFVLLRVIALKPIMALSILLLSFLLLGITPGRAKADELASTILLIKPSVVGIGTMLPTRAPPVTFVATGFVVGDGLSVISNAHAVSASLAADKGEALGIVTGSGSQLQFRPARLAGIDREHDLVHLRLSGAPLPALRLAAEAPLEGAQLAFTGFPLGMMLGLVPATHRATLAAISPIVLPAINSRALNARAVGQLQKPAFAIFQLDGTAYPGNSGSPLFDPASGDVVGVVNMTLLKGSREGAISTPSGISYAIPARHVAELLRQAPAGK
jgi:S1-C subfamily serine protease